MTLTLARPWRRPHRSPFDSVSASASGFDLHSQFQDHKCEGKSSVRNPSLQAALARQNQSQKNVSQSQKQKQKQSQMESDEAFARALQESMSSSASSPPAPAMTQEELDRMMALQLSQGMTLEQVQEQQRAARQQQQQQQGGSNSSCVMS